MPAKNPRISIAPSDDAHAVIVELSKLTGESRARIVHDLIDAALPALRFTIESLKQYHSATSEAEKAALASVYEKAEKGLERFQKQVQAAADAAVAGTGAGAGVHGGVRSSDAGVGASTGAGAGRHGEAAQAYVDRRPGGFAVLREDGMAVDRPSVLAWFDTEAEALAFAASVNGGAHDGTAP